MDLIKVVRPGKVQINGSRAVDVFCKIELVAGKLSISGVEGPKSNGDAHGGCGRIDMGYAHRDPVQNDHRYTQPTSIVEFAEGWNQDRWFDFLDIWHRWHLNDMRAGCEHQRAEEWGKEQIEVVSYKLTHEAYQMRKAAEKKAADAALRGVVAELTETERALLACEWFRSVYQPPDADSPLSGCYEVEKRETKQSGWVRPEEHARGVLCKPCPICGYQYGSKWLRDEVPQDVVDFLAALPESDVKPAWV